MLQTSNRSLCYPLFMMKMISQFMILNWLILSLDVISKLKFKQSQVNSKRKRSCKFPCSICSKSVNKNQKAIQCDQCKLWSHASCNGITKSEYELLVHEDDDVPWFCLPCQILNCADVFPFGLSSKSELLQLNGIDLPSQLAVIDKT